MKEFGITMVHEGDTAGPDGIEFVSGFEKFIYSEHFRPFMAVLLTFSSIIAVLVVLLAIG